MTFFQGSSSIYFILRYYIRARILNPESWKSLHLAINFPIHIFCPFSHHYPISHFLPWFLMVNIRQVLHFVGYVFSNSIFLLNLYWKLAPVLLVWRQREKIEANLTKNKYCLVPSEICTSSLCKERPPSSHMGRSLFYQSIGFRGVQVFQIQTFLLIYLHPGSRVPLFSCQSPDWHQILIEVVHSYKVDYVAFLPLKLDSVPDFQYSLVQELQIFFF